MARYQARRWVRVNTTMTDEQKRKLYKTQADAKRARIKAMSPEEQAAWRKNNSHSSYSGRLKRLSKMSPSELNEYQTKRSHWSRESKKRKIARMSPEERRAYYKLKNNRGQARHKAFKFLSNMAKIGSAVKAIAFSTQTIN